MASKYEIKNDGNTQLNGVSSTARVWDFRLSNFEFVSDFVLRASDFLIMIDSLYIAWKYISFNKIKTATLVACVTLISFLPLSLQLLLEESERQLMSRAVSTPLVVGAKGSALDLVMNTLYFDDEVPELITVAASNRVMETDLALPIPVYARFQARGNPIVGTTLDYFDFRDLRIAQGGQLSDTCRRNDGRDHGDRDARGGEHLRDRSGLSCWRDPPVCSGA